ncbi:MAG: FAD-dependent oxidoreductase, partial [Candidatus Methylomirabilales bacterium]
MGRLRTEVLVVGGGIVGVGVARDTAMRGFSAVLAEAGDLGGATTARFHGHLHSGARYVLADPRTASMCIRENRILRRIAGRCIQDTGGMVLATPRDDPGYAEGFVEGCLAAGIPVEEMDVAEALRRERRLHPSIARAFAVPDAVVDPWKLVSACARAAEDEGARILPRHRVLRLLREGNAVTGAVVRNEQEVEVRAEIVVNASGPWTGRVAALAGCSLPLLLRKGVVVATEGPPVGSVVSRCRSPADGDIIVPVGRVGP